MAINHNPVNADLAVRPAYRAFGTVATMNTGISATRFVYIGVSGTYTMTFAGDAAGTTLAGLTAGTVYPFCVTKIQNAAGNGAVASGEVIALY